MSRVSTLIQIPWNNREYLINEERITWVTKIKHDAHGDGTTVIVNFSEVGEDKTLHFRSEEGNVDAVYALIHSAMKQAKNQFIYSGKEDKESEA